MVQAAVEPAGRVIDRRHDGDVRAPFATGDLKAYVRGAMSQTIGTRRS
jgi:hypothetical protein